MSAVRERVKDAFAVLALTLACTSLLGLIVAGWVWLVNAAFGCVP